MTTLPTTSHSTEMRGGRTSMQKLGRLLAPINDIAWMSTFTGASFALQRDDSPLFDIFVTGRDASNRSRIGTVVIDIRDPTRVLEISPEPVLSLGELGTFDENGTSYPCLVKDDGHLYLYYTGWMPSVLTPFQNHLGLAVERPDGTFRRVSRAPIMARTDEDPFSIGAVFVLREPRRWRMWYTSFRGWGKSSEEPKHTYVIKYAESRDGITWNRSNHVAIDLLHSGEHSISRPSVIHYGDYYHMWYCYRGDRYRIGYAISEDGIHWDRRDEKVGLTMSESGWDSESMCYPHVFTYESDIYMLYCGNEYGRAGLGIAKL